MYKDIFKLEYFELYFFMYIKKKCYDFYIKLP